MDAVCRRVGREAASAPAEWNSRVARRDSATGIIGLCVPWPMKTRRRRMHSELEERPSRGLRHSAIERHDARDRIGHGKPEAIGDGRSFAEPNQVNAFGVDMEFAAGMGHRFEQILVGSCILTPGKPGPAGWATANRLWSARASGDVIAAGQVWYQASRSVLIAAIGMEQHHERIGVFWLIVGRKEQPHRTVRVVGQEGRVEALARSVASPGSSDFRHGRSVIQLVAGRPVYWFTAFVWSFGCSAVAFSCRCCERRRPATQFATTLRWLRDTFKVSLRLA